MFQHVSRSSESIHAIATSAPTATTLSPADIALARHHGYALLSRLYLDGLTPALLPYVNRIPELAAALPQPFDPDEAAAGHYDLLAHSLFPYEAFFLGSAGLLGGEISRRTGEVYERAGYRVATSPAAADPAPPDHVGHELGFLAFLCAAEAAGNDEAAGANHCRSLQQAFFEEHLLRWIAPLAIAIRCQSRPFYTALTNLTLDLLHDHYADRLAGGNDAPSTFILPDYPELSNDCTSSLNEVVRLLLAPPFGGLFLSRDAIAQTGRRLDLPVGFGGREELLSTLLRSAGQYDAAPAALNALHNTQSFSGRQNIWRSRGNGLCWRHTPRPGGYASWKRWIFWLDFPPGCSAGCQDFDQ
jgi:hypothetical protein